MARFTLLLLVAFAAMSVQSPDGKDKLDWMIGSWEGVGYQIDGKTWDIQLDFVSVDKLITIQYASLGCGGTWKLSDFKDTRATFVENIVTGTDRCDQGCKVVVTQVNETHISLAYFLESYSKDVIAYSVLVKK